MFDIIGAKERKKLKDNKNKKLVVFDWGDVLLDVNSPVYNSYTAIKNIGHDMGFDQHSFITFLKKKEFWTTEGEKLELLINEYLEEVNSEKTVEDFKECYLKHFRQITWFEDMIEFLTSLHDQGVCTGIISNLCQLDGELLAEKLPMDKIDYRFYSYNLGVEKPDSKVYEIVETVSGCSPENIFFMDDKQKNIDAAVARGWRGICATGDEITKIKEEVYRFINTEH
ncbi:MAG: HAD-IA family hydrolase [Lachnospiraceae bacterium]|nr:HAD-IA family hydrolase [Lachnospiraceae bacterium]